MNKKSLVSELFSRMGAFFAMIVGRMHWSSPPWMIFLRRQAAARPAAFWTVMVATLCLLVAAIYGYCWYKNLPKPKLPTAYITAPKITPLREEALIPDDLIIDFGSKDAEGELLPKSVAPLQLIGKNVPQGIELSPALEGEWYWQSDSRLIFTPAKDWPAGQDYTVRFGEGVLAEPIRLQNPAYSFSTQPFTAEISQFKLHQDPTQPKLLQAVATIHFNYPVEVNSLEGNLSLLLQTLHKGKLDKEAKHYKFTLDYDQHKRIAYLRSEPLSLTDTPQYLVLVIGEGVRSVTGPGMIRHTVSKNLLLPDMGSYFKVAAATAAIVRNEQDRPEQILALETSAGISETELKKALHVYLLPQNYPATAHAEEKKNYEWQNPGEVTSNILQLATPLKMEAIPAEHNYATLHSFKFNAQTPRYIYLKLDKGARALGDFVLTQDYTAIIKVPPYPQEISFLHKGALLALSGERKLSVLIRGLPAVKFEFARVLPDNINQLVTQTEGDFNNPYFINQSFDQKNISEIFSEIQQFDASDLTKQQYTALDFTKYLANAANTGGPQGLFLLQAQGWNQETQEPLDVRANRLVLVTDMGLVVKDNQDGSHDVFVQSITTGTPLPNVNVTVLGKNGLPLLSYATNEQGQAHFPVLTDFVNEREPVVYLASLGADVSFIPYNNVNRQLNYSRYDVGGIYSAGQEQHSLSAYVFSDRGIYRPGDEVHVGVIVKQAYAQPQPPGFIVQATVSDPRGMTVFDKKFTVDALGYLSFDFPTHAASPTGDYFISLYIVKDQHPESLLGSSSIRVAEFLPDRMRIKANILPQSINGWVSPTNLKAKVQLWNLYGAPAAERRISGKILLEPKAVEFKNYPDYVFADPLLDPKKPAKVFTDNLADAKTDMQGVAEFPLQLERFDKATYQLTFFAEGFEADGGRSVATRATTLVSPLPYFVGYKADGDLNYIKQNSQRSVNFIAINPKLQQQALGGMTLQLVALQPVSTLIKNDNGTYKYQSIIQTKVLATKPFAIAAKGSAFDLPTEQIGDFAINVLDKDGTELSHLKFSVVGASQKPLAKNAELSVKLDRTDYKAGEEIELQITAPYTGSGLITIERDKVYAVQWFKTGTSSSVQKIRIPSDFQGNGYVNVAFVRDWNSPDIFISPLSYSVVPFNVDHDQHAMHINLHVPETARPGEPYKMEYYSDKPGKIIVFAVDEGILQVARFTTPDPLGFFFQKRALEVLTQQTVDQILPRYIRERELSAAGGDGGEDLLSQYLNPFKRKTDLPVAFWSGIVDTDSSVRQLVYEIPDYFNGTLHVMAVAVALDAVGSAEKTSEIKGDFIINPNTPTFVAPGDEFAVTASVANNIKGAGNSGKVAVELKVSPELEIIGSDNELLMIEEGREKTVQFKLRATTSALGSARMTFTASLGGKASEMDATVSIRPATHFSTTVTSGSSNGVEKTIAVDRNLYPQYRQVDAAMSSSPLILLAGLQRYLDNFPYGCTEQLVSKAFPLLAIGAHPWLVDDAQKATEKITTTIQMLGQRQMVNGGFSYWPGLGENDSNTFASVYAMHFLTEAKEQGYRIPDDLYNGGLSSLKDLAARNASDVDMARLQAYAIYVLTRNEMVTTNYLTNLQLYLDKAAPQKWQHELTGAYIAASYKMLKNTSEAEQLIRQYEADRQMRDHFAFYDNHVANAQYLYLIAQHFPERLPEVGNNLLKGLVSAVNTDDINTILSAYTSLALSAYAKTQQNNAEGLVIRAVLANKEQETLATLKDTYAKVSVHEEVKSIIFANPEKHTYFYQLSQAGFDKSLPTEARQQGLEIHREYRDSQGNIIASVALGDEIEVHIQVRSLNDQFILNGAIVDLLPGGFEVLRESIQGMYFDYVDIREDRVVFFDSFDSAAKELVYRMKATNAGKYTVPPLYAEAMYEPSIKANTAAGKITVTKP
ncbi:alpha-2-macroglobulin [Legionella septentrionalis]|uniref:Alpha-2-macroglobulin n=1 Tax=Legionella septentrionalis TaxID=2498109 RepID=A0A433JKI5_9GAMM|nr:alpha-2-macroglobulin [Legionella septentrionalis]RUQ88844.1 alpha-2-macroglobulin [Legionella septentrionalis]